MGVVQNRDIIVINLGAGKHSKKNINKYKNLINECISASLFHEDPINRLLSITDKLERNKLTNTGIGSSLNYMGSVECDASFMERDRVSNKKKIGTMYNIKSPTPIRKTITYHLGETISSEMHVTKPITVDYNSVFSISEECLISEKSKGIYDAYEREVKTYQINDLAQFSRKVGECISDTIGTIMLTPDKTYVATSSGGNFFKIPGRIGCAGVMGAAIYSDANDYGEITISCSGNGEDIIMMDLARYVSIRLLDLFAKRSKEHQGDIDFGLELMEFVLNKAKEFDMRALDNLGDSILYLGIIVLVVDKSNGDRRLVYCHSTENLYFGFKSHDREIECVFSHNKSVGKFLVGGFKL